MKPPFSVSGKSYRDSGSPVVSGLSENKFNRPVVSSTNTENTKNFLLTGKAIKSLFSVFSKSYRDSNLPLVSKHLENKIDKPIVGSINVSYSPTFSLVGSGQFIREFEIDSAKHILGRLRTLPGIPLTDDINAFELFSYQLRRTLSDFIDPAGIDDIAFFDTNKGIKDFPIAGDGDIFFQIGSVRQDLSLASENFTFQYSKPLQDTFSADESFTFQYGKLPADLTGPVTDSSTLLFDKGASDSANASVALNYIVDKVLSDTVLGKDLLGITDGSTFSFGMAESDRAVILEQILVVLGVYAYYSDSAQTFDDNLIFNTLKSLDDQAQSLEDFTFNLLKTLFDLAQANENAVLTFNKSLSLDSASVSDADPTFITDKGLSDLFNIIENAIWSFNKGEFDVSNVNENLTWLYNKPQFDSAQALENSAWLLNKPQFDISNVSDNQSLNSNKGLSDTTELNDEILTYSLQKVLSDVSNALDLVGINDGSTFQFNMVEASLVNISESIRLVLQIFRDFTESITSSESLNYQINKSILDTSLSSDSNTFDIQKVYSDVSQIIEAISLSFDMGNISESSNVNENSVINTGKNLSDIANISEIISIFIDLRRFIDDIVNASEDLSLAVEKVLSDTTLAKDLLGVTDGATFTFGMSEGDIITSVENLNFNSNKVLTDLSNIPDDYFLYQQTYFDSDYIVNGQAYVVFNYRSPTINIFGLPFTELPVDASDVSYLSFGKLIQDVVNPDDIQSFVTNKIISDLTDAIDNDLQFAIAKVLADTTLAKDLLGVTDGATFTFGMAEGDIANASETFTRVVGFNRNINDSSSVIETKVIEFDKSLADIINATEQFNRIVSYYRSLTDTTLAKDLLGVTDGATFTFGMAEGDTVNAAEVFGRTVSFNRLFSDSALSTETKVIEFDKSLADIVNATEQFNRIVSYYRTLSDTALGGDLLDVTDGATFTFGMVKNDIANASESISTILDARRAFIDYADAVDIFTRIVTFVRDFAETVNIPQTYELFSQNYFDSDYIVNGQSYVVFNYRSPLVNIFGLPFTELLNVNENLLLASGKFLSESLTASENSEIAFNKSLSDAVDIIELLNIASGFYKVFTDTALAKDLLGVTDGSTFSFGMVEGDIANASETFTRVVGFNRNFTDSSSVIETKVIEFDKSLADIINATEQFTRIVDYNRSITDTTETPDNSTFSFGMVKGDVTNVSEVFSRIIDYNRSFTDQANVTESISTLVSFIREFTEFLEASQTYELFSQNYFDSDYIVNGQAYVVFNYRSPTINIFGLPFTELVNGSESLLFTLAKVLNDTSTVSENSRITFNKFNSDVVNATESFTKITQFNRAFSDTTLAKDLLGVTDGSTFSFGMVEGDAANASDLLTRIVEYNREFSDITSIGENSIWSFNKNREDQTNVTESLSAIVDKVLSDSALITDGPTFVFGMTELDQVDVSESILKEVAYNRSFTNQVNTSDLVEFLLVINRNLTENLEASQVYELFSQNYFDSDYIVNGQAYVVFNYRSDLFDIYGLPFTESMSVSENSIWTFNKDRFDSVQSTDTSTIIFGKNPTDQINTVDTNLAFVLSKVLTDTVLGKDLLGVTDGSTFTFGMVEGDITNASESFTRIVDYNRTFTDTTETSDNSAFTFGMVEGDQVNASESLTKIVDYNRTFTDTTETSDNSAFTFGMVEGDITNASESFTRIVDYNRSITDTTETPDNSAFLFGMTESDQVNASELLTKIVDYNRTFTDTTETSDNSTFTFGMVEGDQVNATESLTRVIDYNRSFTDQANTTDLLELLLVINREFTENLEADQTYELFSQNYFDSDYIVNGQSYVVFNYRSPTVNIFGLPFTELANGSESLLFTLAKVLSDTTSASENSQITSNKVLSDAANGSESLLFTLAKVLSDTTSASENSQITSNKVLSDAAEVAELLTSVTDYNRSFTDTVLGKDLLGVTDGSTFTFGMVEGDIINASELLTSATDYNRSFSDTTETSEVSSFVFDKVRVDTASASENTTIELGKILSDTTSASENNIIDFNKVRSDQANATETSDLNFNKVRADQANATENNVIDFNKARSDQANATESLTKSVGYNRSLTDTSEVTETIELLVQTLKDFIDTANVSDPYLIYKQNYFDSDTYSIGYTAYEYRSPTGNGYYLPFTNTANVSETSDFNISKAQNEQINTNDQTNLDIDKNTSDTVEAGDSGVIYQQSYFAEDYVEFTYALESTAF
jgi:predicted trehalose synthase